MNKKLLIGIAGVAIVLVGGAALWAGNSASAKTGKYDFETVAIAKGDVARVISASGAVQPREKVPVGSEVSGKVTEVLVDYNDKVKKGQVLAQVDPESFQNTLDQARARELQAQASVATSQSSIDRAVVALDIAEKNYNRQKALFAEQAIAQSAMEQADQTYKNAQLQLESEKVSLKSSLAGLETAKATVQDAITKLSRTKIISPIDGVIIDRKVERGQTVQSSQAIATLFQVAADLSEIQIEASVVESDIGGIDPSDTAVFTVDAFPGERFQGQVVQVRQLGTESANVVTYTVVVNARNPSGRLLPGMTANVEITADRAANVLRVPNEATKFTPPKEILEAWKAQGAAGGQGGPGGAGGPGGFDPSTMTPEQMAAMRARFEQQGGAGGGQGGQRTGGQGGGQGGGNRGFGGGGGPGGQDQFTEMLKTAGVDEARATKIMTEMRSEMEKAMASIPNPTQGGGGIITGGGGFGGPPPSILQQQAGQERRAKMNQVQEAVFRKNLNEAEYAAVSKARAEMQTQKRVTLYKVNDKGELERHQVTIGLSDGSFSQIIRGAAEGDKFVVRAAAAGTGKAPEPQKP